MEQRAAITRRPLKKLQEKQEMGVDILRGTCYNKQA